MAKKKKDRFATVLLVCFLFSSLALCVVFVLDNGNTTTVADASIVKQASIEVNEPNDSD